MAIKSIMVAYSGDASGSGGLRLALQMACKYDAHLTGVVSHGPSLLEAHFDHHMSDEVLQIIRDRDVETVTEIRAEFEAHAAAAGRASAASFIDLQTSTGFSLTECARNYDIVIMGRRVSEAGREHFGERPEEVALHCGRPVMLVPHGYDAPALNEHALVAWDGKRAAARALGDAMHILETKARVTVLSVGDLSIKPRFGDDIVTLLERHGVIAEQLVCRPEAEGISRTILAACAKVGAGLLVMGAYEHSRIREELFGGVTRDIMDQADLPVMMSH